MNKEVRNMGFINDIRSQRGDKDVSHNPLDAYSKYSFEDVLNAIYIIDDIREKGNNDDAKRAHGLFVKKGVSFNVKNQNVGVFLSYLMEKSASEIERNNEKPEVEVDDTPLTDSEKLVSAIIIRESLDAYSESDIVKYDTMCKFLDLSHGRTASLSDLEYAQLSGYNDISETSQFKSITRELVANYPIPEVTHIEDIYDTPDLSALYDQYGKDDFFKSRYKIKNVYAVANNKQSENAHKQGTKSMILNSGTSNESLVKILSGGFKLPSQLARDAGVQMSGQMYGDAVYFARPNQISKNTAYVDRVNSGSKFIMVAEVFYDKKIDASNTGGRFKYDGHTLVHAHNVGRYDRDEYMVHPSQVEIKYVLEVDNGKLRKPMKDKTKNYANSHKNVVALDLDDLSNAQQL